MSPVAKRCKSSCIDIAASLETARVTSRTTHTNTHDKYDPCAGSKVNWWQCSRILWLAPVNSFKLHQPACHLETAPANNSLPNCNLLPYFEFKHHASWQALLCPLGQTTLATLNRCMRVNAQTAICINMVHLFALEPLRLQVAEAGTRRNDDQMTCVWWVLLTWQVAEPKQWRHNGLGQC